METPVPSLWFCQAQQIPQGSPEGMRCWNLTFACPRQRASLAFCQTSFPLHLWTLLSWVFTPEIFAIVYNAVVAVLPGLPASGKCCLESGFAALGSAWGLVQSVTYRLVIFALSGCKVRVQCDNDINKMIRWSWAWGSHNSHSVRVAWALGCPLWVTRQRSSKLG